MKKLGLAALALLPLVGGCYAETYPPAYYAHRPSVVRVYGPPVQRVILVAPPAPRVRVYW
jgi:hypothetical protein